MRTRKNEAAEMKRSGKYNCTQSIVCTYKDFTGLDEATSLKMTHAFAAGMGNMEGTCGALIGAGIVLGMVNDNKVKSMKDMRMIMDKFQQRNHATQCKILKGVGTKVTLRECPDCVADVCEFLEEIISQEA